VPSPAGLAPPQLPPTRIRYSEISVYHCADLVFKKRNVRIQVRVTEVRQRERHSTTDATFSAPIKYRC
jgi:hypothetical protein